VANLGLPGWIEVRGCAEPLLGGAHGRSLEFGRKPSHEALTSSAELTPGAQTWRTIRLGSPFNPAYGGRWLWVDGLEAIVGGHVGRIPEGGAETAREAQLPSELLEVFGLPHLQAAEAMHLPSLIL
jgi:hypothetical protein